MNAGSAARSVKIAAGEVALDGDLSVPPNPVGVVLFAHGSGSSRTSPRNRLVAEALRSAGFATLLMDLLTAEEEYEDLRTARLRFDIDLLSGRLIEAIARLGAEPETAALPIGLFGASTGAAAALVAAARRPDAVRAVVSRGGRPDLAGGHLARVRAPTLLVVGELDDAVMGLNEEAHRVLERGTEARISVVAGARHLFEEPGALEEVSRLASEWFTRSVGRRR